MGGKGEEARGETVRRELHGVGSDGGEEWKEILAETGDLTPAPSVGLVTRLPLAASPGSERSRWVFGMSTSGQGRWAESPAATAVSSFLLACFVGASSG